MTLPVHWVDAFSDVPFAGNPAAIVLCDRPVPEAWMQDLAFEFGIAETAFVRIDAPDADGAYPLRWFTPTVEVDLCGHATLAAAHVAFGTGLADDRITFATRSGPLTCTRVDDRIALDLPVARPEPAEAPRAMLDALGVDTAVAAARSTGKWLIIELDAASTVEGLEPDIDAIGRVGDGCVVVTALGGPGDADIVSRVFGPGVGVPEDPVTGSAHCILVPYWTPRFGRTELVARQASARGGVLHCRLLDDRVELAGVATTVLRGEVDAPAGV